jgi:hypothetical protein
MRIEPIDVMVFDDHGKVIAMKAYWSAADVTQLRPGWNRNRPVTQVAGDGPMPGRFGQGMFGLIRLGRVLTSLPRFSLRIRQREWGQARKARGSQQEVARCPG